MDDVPKSQKPKLTYSIADAAGQLGLSEVYVRRLVSEGKIAAVRFGRRVMVRKAELERVAEEGIAS